MPRLSILAAVAAASLFTAEAGAQGVTPYDTYRDAYGSPNYTGNLTPAPDDRTLLGPSAGVGDPFLTRTRPARGYGEVADIDAGFWAFQADRLRQRSQSADEADARNRGGNALRRR